MCCVLLGYLMALLGGTAVVALTGVAADPHYVTADVCLSTMLACAGVVLSLHCVTDVPVMAMAVVMSVQLVVMGVELLAVNW